MGLLDRLTGSGKELEELRKELASCKERLRRAEFERDDYHKKNLHLIDKTHAFFQRLRLLVGTLDDEHVVARAWDLLDMALGIKKGGIFDRTDRGWVPAHAVGFPNNQPPIIPLEEDSMATYVAEHGVPLSIPQLRKQDDLGYLERRGVIPDIKIACPIRVRGKVERVLLICSYAGNVFANEDDLETLEMVTTLLGLVQTNATILAEQRQALAQTTQALQEQTQALGKLRSIFQRLVAPEVIDHLEKNPDGIVLGGTRQTIVIMFVDIRGFTQMSENQPPEKIIELLNRYFTRVTDIVLEHKGTLDKFMGDAAMVLFGTPVPIDQPVDRAVAAALKIQDMVQANMAEWVSLGFPAFSVGIGITYQDVVVGNVGSQKLSSFTAIGDGVNLAFRLSSIARGGEILVSESVFENLHDWQGKVEQRPQIQLKGKAEPQIVYALSRYDYGRTGLCPQCGAPVADGVRFCGSCGYRRF